MASFRFLGHALLLIVMSWGGVAPAKGGQSPEADLDAARLLFEANLDAIRRRDRSAYLSCYLKSETLARVGPEGVQLGYESLAETTGEGWPDFFSGEDLRLVSVRPGLVYGTYRYRVRYGEEEQTGLSERFFLKTDQGWKIAVTTSFAAPPGTPPPPKALVGATLIRGTDGPPVPDSVVLIRGGQIECAGRRTDCPVPAGVASQDLRGMWIAPGLIDAHVHFSQTGWADGRPDALDLRERFPYEQAEADLRADPERFFRAYLCSGVTSVYDVGGYPWTWELRDRTARNTRAPQVLATGPLLSTWDFWLNLPGERQFMYLADESSAQSQIQYLAAHHANGAKIWFLPVQERDFEDMEKAVLAAGALAGEQELPLLVHATGLREAKVALRAGAHLLVHSVWDREVDEEFLNLARKAGTYYCPTLAVRDGYLALYESVVSGEPPLLDDPNRCLDAETRRKALSTAQLGSHRVDPDRLQAQRDRLATAHSIGATNLARVHAAGIPVVMGTDAGNPLTLHGPSVYREMEAMQAAGLTASDVLIASTRNAARALGLSDSKGTVEAGKTADLLILSADPTLDIRNLRRLEYVVREGEIRGLEELRSR